MGWKKITRNNVIAISQVHQKIHEGKHYFVTGSDALNTGDTVEFVIETPTDRDIHMSFAYTSNKAFTMEAWEDVTYTGGTDTTPVNSNRQSTNSSALVVKKNPTTVDTTGATKIIESIAIGTGGRRFNPTEVLSSRENEIVLKRGTKYYYKLTSDEDGATVTYYGSWYEEEE